MTNKNLSRDSKITLEEFIQTVLENTQNALKDSEFIGDIRFDVAISEVQKQGGKILAYVVNNIDNLKNKKTVSNIHFKINIKGKGSLNLVDILREADKKK